MMNIKAIKALNFAQLLTQARLKKKGKKNVGFFSPEVKEEIEQIIKIPYNSKTNQMMMKLIAHLNVIRFRNAAEELFEVQSRRC